MSISVLEGILMSWDVGPVFPYKGKYAYRVTLRFDSGEAKQQKGGFVSKVLANKARDVTVAELHNGEYVFYPKITTEDFLCYWMKNEIEPRCSPASVYTYWSRIRTHIVPVVGHSLIDHISQARITTVLEKACETSQGIAKSVLSILRAALTYAKGMHVVSNNPLTNYKLPKRMLRPSDELAPYRTIVLNKQNVLTLEQSTSLIVASKDTPYFLPILLSLTLGLRKG